MRNLSITRIKSFVASLGKMKVYIEDPDQSELVINGVPCRKLGILKNGETATFPIGEQAARVFVIADKASRNFSNDCYPVPAGTEDVVLSGKNHFHPGAGNPFRFEGVTDPALLASRKKGSRKGILILILALILGFAIGFAKNLPAIQADDPKVFTAEDMSVTLTKAFREVNYQGFTQCFESNTVAVFTLEEEFSLLPGSENYSLEEYAELVAGNNGMDSTQLKQEQGVLFFEYVTQGSDGEDYYYMITLHRGGEGFWLIQFATPASNQHKLYDQFLTWASSVRFD